MRDRMGWGVRGALAALVAVVAVACVPPPGSEGGGPTTVEMNAAWSNGFFSLPWPNAIRKQADGTLDLAGLPTKDNFLLSQLVQIAAKEVRDFGTNSAMYLRFTGPIDESSLPGPSRSASPDSPLQVVALDGSGHRVPVVARVEPADGYRARHLVSLLPYPGHALRTGTAYAVLVTSGIRTTDGEPVAPAPLIDALDGPFLPGAARSESHWLQLRSQRDAARAALDATTAWSADDLVGFTVFRTAESTSLMEAVAAAIDEFPVEVPELTPGGECDGTAPRRHFSGELAVPRFQLGNTPRTFEGGRITVGPDGRAVVRSVDRIQVRVSVPCGEAPEQGWAIQTFINGTNGNADGSGGFGREASRTVIGSIAPLYSPQENGDAFHELLFYNFLNPPAARTNPIQQAADNRVLVRMLQQLELDGSLVGSGRPVRTDDDTVIVTGHSQGAQTVALVAATTPEVKAIVTSAATSGQYNSISYRSDVREIVAAVVGDSRGIDVRSPVVQVIQTLMDVAEPANFPTSGHWLNFAGRDDGCLPLEASRHLAASQGLVVVDPQWGSIFGDAALDPEVATAPVAGNGPGGTTRASIEIAGGHRVAYANTALVGEFIDEVAVGGTPTTGPGPWSAAATDACAPRYGEIGNHD